MSGGKHTHKRVGHQLKSMKHHKSKGGTISKRDKKKVSEERQSKTHPFGEGDNYDRELVENYMSTVSRDGSTILPHLCHYLGYTSEKETCAKKLECSDYGQCIMNGVFPGATDPMTTFFEQCHLYTYITPNSIEVSLKMLNAIWGDGGGGVDAGADAAHTLHAESGSGGAL